MPNLKLDTGTILEKLRLIAEVARRFSTLIVIVIFSGMYAYLMLQVNSINQKTPNADAVTEKLKETSTPKIDAEAAQKLSALEDQNIELKSLFNQARSNPFEEQ
jgi:hypothetical protein